MNQATKKGIVLRALDYQTSSYILYLYTDEGLRSVLARGAKKLSNPIKSFCDMGVYMSYQISEKKLPTLKNPALIKRFGRYNQNYDTFLYVSYIFELILKTIDDNNDHKKMMDFIIKLLNILELTDDPEQYTFIFELKLLYFLGYGLSFNNCIVCGKDTQLTFSPHQGGMVCSEHFNGISHFHQYHIIEQLLWFDVGKDALMELDKSIRMSIRSILDSLIYDFLGYDSQARKLLKTHIKY
jgi:DNA repair protein RecO (recombination protein O)